MLMLFGETNVGKTLTQQLIHFGQGEVRPLGWDSHDTRKQVVVEMV